MKRAKNSSATYAKGSTKNTDGARREAKLRDQYFNCIEKIRPHFHLIENARKAFAKEGVTPIEAPVRGGTDGCTLSFMGLPCPNLSTGGLNAHSVLEFIPTDALETMVRVLLRLVEEYGTKRLKKDKNPPAL